MAEMIDDELRERRCTGGSHGHQGGVFEKPATGQQIGHCTGPLQVRSIFFHSATIAPLPVEGGTGSPLNPLAISWQPRACPIVRFFRIRTMTKK